MLKIFGVNPFSALVEDEVSPALTGVSGTGTVNNVSAYVDTFTAVTGVSGTGTVNDVSTTADGNVAVTGVSGTGTVNDVSTSGTGNVTVTGVLGTGEVHDVAANGEDNVVVSPTGVLAAGEVHMVQVLYNIGDVPIIGGMPIALVGDFVGTGTVGLNGDVINNQITYKDIPIALTGAVITPHTGLHHPSSTLPATLALGSPDCTVGDIYRIVRIGDPATCGDQVTMNPDLVSVIERNSDLREPGNPAVPA